MVRTLGRENLGRTKRLFFETETLSEIIFLEILNFSIFQWHKMETFSMEKPLSNSPFMPFYAISNVNNTDN